MLNKFLTICGVLIIVNGSAYNSASAQECSVPYEMVTKLHHPDIGSYTVWDSAYGEEQKDERFISILNHGDNGVLAVGEAQNLNGAAPSMVFVAFDKRGRKIWDKYHSIRGLKNIVKMLRHGDGLVVLANRRKLREKDSLWLGFFDEQGRLKSQKIISDKKYNLFANDITKSIDGNGFAIPVSVDRELGSGKNKIMQKNAVVYLLDKNGNELSSRSYILGTDNEIEGLSVSKFAGEISGYIATGYFESPTGQKIGWVLRLNDDLSYMWQKEYRRGLSANIKIPSGYRDRYILTFGEVMPVDSKAVGSWLMLLDGANGDIMWQRYYYGETGSHDYSSKGIYVNNDGLITLMMMADVIQGNGGDIGEYMSYAHLLTLSPRGVTLSGDSYYYGKGVNISQLIEGVTGGRIMAGYSNIPIKDLMLKNNKIEGDKPPPLKEIGDINLPDIMLSDKANKGLAMLKSKIKDQKFDDIKPSESANFDNGSNELTQDGWVLVGEMPEAYTDPCSRKVRQLK